jgi:hypothetical protein
MKETWMLSTISRYNQTHLCPSPRRAHTCARSHTPRRRITATYKYAITFSFQLAMRSRYARGTVSPGIVIFSMPMPCSQTFSQAQRALGTRP